MYSSNLMFHTLPGKTGELENELHELLDLVRNVGGQHPRILHAHFASPDAANVIFAQDAPDLPTLEEQIRRVTADPRFQQWTKKVSPLLRQSPNRELYLVVSEPRQKPVAQ
jgi:quinol monooxygenase YgiN